MCKSQEISSPVLKVTYKNKTFETYKNNQTLNLLLGRKTRR